MLTQFLDADLPSNLEALKTRIESTLAISLKWFTQNRLKINTTKTGGHFEIFPSEKPFEVYRALRRR